MNFIDLEVGKVYYSLRENTDNIICVFYVVKRNDKVLKAISSYGGPGLITSEIVEEEDTMREYRWMLRAVELNKENYIKEVSPHLHKIIKFIF